MEQTTGDLSLLNEVVIVKDIVIDWIIPDLNSFDVVIPAKNSENTIMSCLKALYSSDVPINRVFIIDKSNDRTPIIASEMDCIVISSDFNYSKALRLGASLCETPYFLILDSDILIHPKFYSKLKDQIKYNFLSKGTFYDQISWTSLSKRLFSQRRKEIGGLDAAFVNRSVFLQLTKDWEIGYIDAGGDKQLIHKCKKLNIPIYQNPDVVNIHLIGSHRRYIKQTYWYGKSGKTNRLYPWTHFIKRFLRGIINGFRLAFIEKDPKYVPFIILREWNYLRGWLEG